MTISFRSAVGISPFLSESVIPKPKVLTRFAGKRADRFEPSFRVIRGQLSPDLQNAILSFERNEKAYTPKGWGADGNVYHLEGIPGYPNGLALKVSHSEPENSQGQMQRVGKTFDEEAQILSTLPADLDRVQRMVAQVQTPRHNYLISTWMSGRSPHPQSNPLTTKHLKHLLKQLAQLDQAGILHRDLKKENLLLDGPYVNLLDFGASIPFDLKAIAVNDQTHHYPSFSPPGNIRNFEDTFLYPYLKDLEEISGPEAVFKLFKQYLPLRSSYHQKRADMIGSLLKTADLTPDDRKALENAQDYEQLQSQVFRRPSDVLLELEAHKIQMTYCTEEAYRHEILEKKPYANLLWKIHSLSTIRRFIGQALQMFDKAKPGSGRQRFLAFQSQLGQYRRIKVYEWYRGAEGWIVENLMGKHDGRDYALDMISQLETPGIVEFKPLVDVATKITSGNKKGE